MRWGSGTGFRTIRAICLAVSSSVWLWRVLSRPSPSIVLADEPTAALDSENGHAVMALLARIAKEQNRSVLAVTHDPARLAMRTVSVRIEDGKIVGEERRLRASTRPKSPI